MNSKTSFFNRTVFHKDCTRLWPVWALYSLILFFALPFQAYLRLPEARGYAGLQDFIGSGAWYSDLAGIQTAAVSVPEPHLRHKVWRALNTDEVAEPNVFAGIAAAAAFRHGGPWLDALRAYLYENKQLAARYLAENVPAVRWVRSEATYLMWLDVSALPDAANFARVLRGRTGLYLTGGAVYRGNGADFLRMNIACPRVRLEDGLERLKRGVESVL